MGDDLVKEEVRIHLPYWVFKNLLERAGSIKREEAKAVSLTNYSGPFTAEQKKEIDNFFIQFVKD